MRDVLYWLRSTTRRYAPYVANRVGTILRTTKVEDWRWVPSGENPADWGTKYRRQENETLWWEGPKFLCRPEEEWPNSYVDPDPVLEVLVVSAGSVKRHPLMPEIKAISSRERRNHCVARSMKFVAVGQKKVVAGAIAEEEREAAKVLVFNEVQL